MSAPIQSVCSPWTTPEEVGRLVSRCAGSDADLLEEMAWAASDTLFHLSGRQFPGSCLDVVRPCGDCGCHLQRWCGCEPASFVKLSPTPVTGIDRVTVDGEVLPEGAYTVLDFDTLVRVDGKPWPRWQRLDRPATAPDTFEVRFAYGVLPPPTGRLAAAVLTCELLQARTDPGACRIPETASRVTRQGISYDLVDLAELAAGLSGLREVDLFLRSVNPHGLVAGATMASPDVGPYARRETGSAL